MIFISKRRFVNFEGCAFNMFTYRTDDPEVIKKLKKSYWYGKDFKEVSEEEHTQAMNDNGVTQYTIEELEEMLAKKKGEVKDNYDELGFNELRNIAKAKGKTWSKTPKREDIIKFLRK